METIVMEQDDLHLPPSYDHVSLARFFFLLLMIGEESPEEAIPPEHGEEGVCLLYHRVQVAESFCHCRSCLDVTCVEVAAISVCSSSLTNVCLCFSHSPLEKIIKKTNNK